MPIRPFDFSEADYQAYVDVFNAAHPEVARAVADVQHMDKTRGSEVLGRWLVEVGGRIAGVIEYESPRNSPKPDTYEVGYRVRPGFEARVGAMWAFLMNEVSRLNPKELQTHGREDWEEYRFYLTQGFVEVDRRWDSVLDLSRFDPTPLKRPLAKDIQIKPLNKLPYSEESFQRAWYDLEIELLRDVPFSEPLVPWAFEVWQQRHVKDPNLLPEGYFVALEGEQMVGLTMLFKSSRPQTLQTGLTGVLQSYRRKGIALALKLRAAEFARAYGAKYIRTSNHQINRPMLAINEAMGFVKEPATVFLRKDFP
ncbi:MAG: GNAT family N-acetyltransferase [Meiothermus sp.]|nr:GNAT family N-acetyltransferase [Meiothermus sp.]